MLRRLSLSIIRTSGPRKTDCHKPRYRQSPKQRTATFGLELAMDLLGSTDSNLRSIAAANIQDYSTLPARGQSWPLMDRNLQWRRELFGEWRFSLLLCR